MHPTHRKSASRALDSEVFSVSHLFQTLRRYTPIISLALFAVATLYVIVAIAIYLLSPTQSLTVQPFRLQFAGAENSTYPNGTKFSTSDIVNAPILTKVYESNDLKRFFTYPEFTSRLFILEQNRNIDSLMRDYEARLADPKLTPIDRERLQREFDLKMQTVARNEFSLNFVDYEQLAHLPPSLVEKILSDVLNTFAEQAMREHGGLDFRLPVISRNIFADARPDTIPSLSIATDVLRTKIKASIHMVERLMNVPGAEVLRTEKEQMSLAEIRARLEDLLRFNIQPLANELRNQPWAGDPFLIRSFFTAQMNFNAFQAAEAQKKQAGYQMALATYLGEKAAPATDLPAAATAGQSQTSPFLSENFVDKIVQLTTRSVDINYRQKLVTQITEAGLATIPFESEVEYYKTLLSASGAPTTSINAEQSRAQLMMVYNEAMLTLDKGTEIYRIVSKNLNPGNVMLTTTSPVFRQRERTVSAGRLALYGILVMTFALPLTIAACLIHNRVREEEEEEEAYEAGVAEELPA